MAASFPNAKKTFSQVVNGVTKLVAALFNVAYNEIEAEQVFCGPTGGGAQSYSESLTNLLYNYRQGCAVEYKGAADLYVRSGEIMVTDASGNRRLRRNTSDTTVTWANIDTGAEANSTTYYVYAVADANATTSTFMISASATTPTGATFFKLIGTFYNDASGNIQEVGNLPKKKGLGNWVDKSSNYGAQQASTDGFVTAYASIDDGGANLVLRGSTDAANPPTTIVNRVYKVAAEISSDEIYSIFFPVKKGDYWLVYMSNTKAPTYVYWIPLS